MKILLLCYSSTTDPLWHNWSFDSIPVTVCIILEGTKGMLDPWCETGEKLAKVAQRYYYSKQATNTYEVGNSIAAA